jgi:DNA-binding transcriptional MerR regulator
MATQLAHKRAYHPPPIPDRLYFKIGDVARLCELETYVLRFWETQFPQLKPNKSGTGQRLYRRREVELALEIKRLVHAEGYTLAGARQALDLQTRSHRRHAPHPATKRDSQRNAHLDSQSRLPLIATEPGPRLDAVAAAISRARAELREIAGLLASPISLPDRRRSRMGAIPALSGSLFPSQA